MVLRPHLRSINVSIEIWARLNDLKSKYPQLVGSHPQAIDFLFKRIEQLEQRIKIYEEKHGKL